MRQILKHRSEVAHYWANKVQPSGRAGNLFFEDGKIYSYGRHFCIARHLPNGVIAMTTRGYSNSTAQHISKVRNAAKHLRTVFCYDPAESAAENMRHAQEEIVSALNDSEKPRIRQTTRDAHKAHALYIAEQANAYLNALPENERGNVTRFDITGLEHIRVVMQQYAETQKRLREDAEKARAMQAVDRLKDWRIDPIISTGGFHALPVALRLNSHVGENCPTVIQTSHGAEIPVLFASRLWVMIEAVRSSGRPMENIGKPCGVYTLNTIRADGSIVVGCHDITYSEIYAIAVQLGYVQASGTLEG